MCEVNIQEELLHEHDHECCGHNHHTCREIKEKLQLIYDQHGVNKRAKSTQIKEFCEVKPIVMRDKSGMSAKGFEIM